MGKKKKEVVLQFDLERQILDDFRQALEDTTGSGIPILQRETSLVHQLGITSLSFLEALQIVSDKYGVYVSSEEMNGAMFAGRVSHCLSLKILEKYNNDFSEIERIAKEVELNLAKNGVRPPVLYNRFISKPEQKKIRG